MKMPSLLQTGVLIATAGLIVSSCAASQASERADMGPPLHPFESEQTQPPEATASLLPEGVGRDTTIRVCSGCHAAPECAAPPPSACHILADARSTTVRCGW